MMTDQKTKKQRVQFLEWMGHPSTRVLLLNLDSDGAVLLMEEKPVLGRPMWIRLEDAAKPDWLEAVPVRYGQSHEVEVHFSHPRPGGFLWAGRHGNDFRSIEDREETRLTRLG
jgi:hypothetical protein